MAMSARPWAISGSPGAITRKRWPDGCEPKWPSARFAIVSLLWLAIHLLKGTPTITRDVAPTEASGANNELTNRSIAFAGVRQFLLQPREAQTLHLLMLVEDVGDLENIRLESTDGVLPVFSFEVRDSRGGVHRYRCNPVQLAILILVQVFGQSAFVNFTDSHPFLKLCGRSAEKAGFVAARLFAGADARLDHEPGQKVMYADRDCRNLTHENLRLALDPRSKAGVEHWLGEVLGYAAEMPDALAAGTQAEKYEAAKKLFELAMARLDEEREVANAGA